MARGQALAFIGQQGTAKAVETSTELSWGPQAVSCGNQYLFFIRRAHTLAVISVPSTLRQVLDFRLWEGIVCGGGSSGRVRTV